jgi:L-ascorbate metabolism protein UlaG (beta-lactamase superfamily)
MPDEQVNDPPTRWRRVADFAKRQPWMLRVADRLGRGRGAFRFDAWLPYLARVRRPSLAGWSSSRLSAVAVGHSTVLLRLGGMNVLTDPVFSTRIGLGAGVLTLGPRRRFPPALTIPQLPKLDLLLVSHAHFDHLDRPSLLRLPHATPVITAPQTRDLIDGLGYRRITELSWGQSLRMNGLTVTAVPCRHWSPRVFADNHRGYNAYLLEADGVRVLFAGDTAFHPGFSSLAPLDLAIVGISAYEPFIEAHATPEQAYLMAKLAGARFVMPMHHGVFRLSREPLDEPLRRFLDAVTPLGPEPVAVRPGERWDLTASSAGQSVADAE